MIIHIKNMVCLRCKMAVEALLNDLNISFSNLKLGEVKLKEALNPKEKEILAKRLKALGFELLEDKNSALVSKIKSIIVQQIHASKTPLAENFSDFIAAQLNKNYSSLSRLFSEVEGITIEKYIALQRIEKIKEYLFYDELSLSQIAFEMHYSSVAHLSAQFKKETGMTPTTFKNQRDIQRNNLDQ